MALEVSVYSPDAPLTGAAIMSLARKKRLQLRFVLPQKCVGLDNETLEQPLKKQDLLIYCWSAKDEATTVVLDRALVAGDQSAILSVQSAMGWFDFRCEAFDYERFWKKFPDERKEFEASMEPAALARIRTARIRYFFRCGLRPKQNVKYLQTLAGLVQDATGGYLSA